MSRMLGNILASILANGIAIWVATAVIPGVSIEQGSLTDSVIALAVVAAMLGLVNAVIKPFLKAVTSCLYVLTFGLMAFVVNAIMLALAGRLAGVFGVEFDAGPFFWSTIGAAVVVTLVSLALGRFLAALDHD